MNEEVTYDWKLLKIYRCSRRVLADILRAILLTDSEITTAWPVCVRTMLINSSWTSADIIVKIPRKLRPHGSLTHGSNMDFFTEIKGIEVCDIPYQDIKLN